MTWEYKIVTSTDDTDDESLLNELGAEGWELVSVHISEIPYISESDDEDEEDEEFVEEIEELATYYLKRPKA